MQKPHGTMLDELGFSKFADVVPHIVWSATAAGEVSFVNAQGLAFTGLTLARLRRSGLKPAVHPEDCGQLQKSWTDSTRDGRPFQMKFRLRRHDGQHRWHLARAEPVRDAGVVLTRCEGTAHMNSLRREELDRRFPGLLDAVLKT